MPLRRNKPVFWLGDDVEIRGDMRIVSGRYRGRILKGPSSQDIRPTSDRLREAVFNVLSHAYAETLEGARVIDLFAGTGALGIEALSRGARFALFVDQGAQARALLRENIETLGLGGVTRIFRRDATRLGLAPPGENFDLAFLDPPYGANLVPPALRALREGGWLAADAVCVIEESAEVELMAPEGFAACERRVYGQTQILILRNAANMNWSG